ncbi:MAG: hypothetical protein IKQ07_06215 [Bacteroidaceae bacterium]|jgi:hypothetical protein|nr:hypothetical protein [Bacteroidaceae bacterium]
MKKIAYEKPSMMIVLLQHKTSLLQASQTPPNEIPDYDDWFGTKEDKGSVGSVNLWDDEW